MILEGVCFRILAGRSQGHLCVCHYGWCPSPVQAGGHPVTAQFWGSTSLQPCAVVHFVLFLPFIFSRLWLPSFRAHLATVVCCPSWDPSQGDFTASHSRWSAPGLTTVPSVCHRWNPGSSWGSRVSPQLWRPSADRELQLPLENDWVSCFNRISLFHGFLSGLKFF